MHSSADLFHNQLGLNPVCYPVQIHYPYRDIFLGKKYRKKTKRGKSEKPHKDLETLLFKKKTLLTRT